MSVQEERSADLPVHEAWLPSEHPLHRPRHGGRQRVALVCAVLFFALPMLALGVGVRPAEFENRQLASFPSPTQGWGFFGTLPAWATDHLPFRDVAVQSADGVSRGVFGEPSPLGTGGAAQGPAGPVAPVGPIGPVVPLAGAPSPAGGSSGVFPQVIQGDDGWLYFGFDVQAKCAPVRPLADTLAAVDRLRAAVERSGRRFVLAVPPDKTTAQPEYLPDRYPGRDCSRAATSRFWDAVADRPDLLQLRRAIDRLATPEQPAYHALDTHWTDRGAIAFTRQLAERIDPGSTEFWRIDEQGTVRSHADLPPLLGRSGDNVYPQYSLAPSGGRDRTGPYLGDLRDPIPLGAGPVYGVVNAPVALIADSFAQSSGRYLAAGFADIEVSSYGLPLGPGQAAASMVDSEVVVLEVVERNLASGTVPLLDPGALDVVIAALDANPLPG